jgi:hypothetical protein
MLTATLLVLLTLWCVGAVLTAVFVARAPEGFEDASGFHFAVRPVCVERDEAVVVAEQARVNFG